jgi:2,4-didehydro-3-deoxy-L-rhamnonate hydrolase
VRLIGFEVDRIRHIGRVEGGVVHDLGEIRAYYEALAGGAAPRVSGDRWALAELTQAPPVPDNSRIFCVGVNYHDHADEAKQAGMEPPEFPVIFGRWAQSLTVDGAEIPLPPNEPGLDWEVELAVVIKDEVWMASREDALQHVFGYTAFNDLSARTKQIQTLQWTLGKNPDKSGAIGPVVVTADELPDGGRGLKVQTRVNGTVMQDANTNDLIHDVAGIVEYIADTVTLLPGDVIATGTPGGVGFARKPPIFLGAGDVVEVEVERIGVLRNTFCSR